MAGGERRDGGILNGVRKWWREKTGFGILGSVLEEAGSGIETGAPPRKEAVHDQAISPSLGSHWEQDSLPTTPPLLSYQTSARRAKVAVSVFVCVCVCVQGPRL